MSIQRNDPCLCGSGKKWKKCCLLKEQQAIEEDEREWAAWFAKDCSQGERNLEELKQHSTYFCNA